MKRSKSLILLALVAPLALAAIGCDSMKAANTTEVIKYVSAPDSGPQHVTYSLMPGNLIGDPALADKSLFIPTVPGKDLDFLAYNPDGTKRMELHTSRSAVDSVLLAGVSTIDAAKFASDAATRAWISQERAAWMSEMRTFVQPLLAAQIAQPTAPAAPGMKEQLIRFLQDPDSIAALKAALTSPPAIVPKP